VKTIGGVTIFEPTITEPIPPLHEQYWGVRIGDHVYQFGPAEPVEGSGLLSMLIRAHIEQARARRLTTMHTAYRRRSRGRRR